MFNIFERKINLYFVLLFIICTMFSSCGTAINDNSNAVSNETQEQLNDNLSSDEIAYEQALSLLEDGKYAEAYTAFYKLNGYRNSAEYLKLFTVLSGEESCVTAQLYVDTIEYKYDSDNWNMALTETDSYGEVEITTYRSGEMKSVDVEVNGPAAFGDHSDSSYENTYENGLLKSSETTVQIGPEPIIIRYEYSYDSNNNLVQIIYSNGNTGTYTYTYEYDSNGALIKAIEPLESANPIFGIYSTTYSYNDSGELIQRIAEIESNGSANYEKIIFDYTYDSNGNLIKEVQTASYTPQTSSGKYEYNGNGDIISYVEIDKNNAEYSGTYDDGTYTYDDDGKLIRTDIGSTVRTYEYNEEGYRTVMVRYYGTDKHTTLYEYQYNQEAVSKGKYISKMTVTEKSSDDNASDPVEYYYDSNGNITRILEIHDNWTFRYEIEYEYDETVFPSKATIHWYEGDEENSDRGVTNLEFTYDDNGFLVKKVLSAGSSTITYEYSEHTVFYGINTLPKQKSYISGYLY